MNGFRDNNKCRIQIQNDIYTVVTTGVCETNVACTWALGNKKWNMNTGNLTLIEKLSTIKLYLLAFYSWHSMYENIHLNLGKRDVQWRNDRRLVRQARLLKGHLYFVKCNPNTGKKGSLKVYNSQWRNARRRTRHRNVYFPFHEITAIYSPQGLNPE